MYINEEWLEKLESVLEIGSVETPRDLKIKELLNVKTTVKMQEPILTVPERNLGYRFLYGEAWWILTGQNRVDSIRPYSRKIASFSDDDITFNGAYGPMIIDQLNYVVDTLHKDQRSRQAVLTIWRPNPRPSKDIPCTISIQFIVRNHLLHVIDNMRSSDLWLGWPYDMFNFTCLAIWVLLALRYRDLKRWIHIDLGYLYLNAGSLHLYETEWAKAYQIIDKYKSIRVDKIPRQKVEWRGFEHPDELVDYLRKKAG